MGAFLENEVRSLRDRGRMMVMCEPGKISGKDPKLLHIYTKKSYSGKISDGKDCHWLLGTTDDCCLKE